MSKIFNALRKTSVVDFGEICQLDDNEESGVLQVSEQPASAPFVPSVLGSNRMVRLRASALSPILPFDTVHHPAAEQYRIIRTKLLHHPQKPQIVVVSSASSGDGKTVSSINIAGCLALKSDSHVLLVDGDLRHCRVSAELGIPPGPGLTEILSGMADLEAGIVQAEQFPKLFILSAGAPAGNPAELLDSSRWHGFLAQIRARFANVIFDGPPVATVADYELLQHSCDGVILIARPDHTNRTACLEALRLVPEQKLLGIVLNCVEEWWLWNAPGYTYYRNTHSDQASKEIEGE